MGWRQDVPLIFVAASLSDVVVEAGELYEAETGNRVEFSFGGSIMLANQIAELGAPADGFFLVGDSPVLILREAGMYSDNNLMSGLVNKLVAIASSDQEPLTSLRELVEQAPRVALGDPALAPVGYSLGRLLNQSTYGRCFQRCHICFRHTSCYGCRSDRQC
ncbi:MAG: hypothetical protein Ct9H300mP19_01030 [Dehalococcoidia bacterium]|nr:MAG: hypothetical protein Ct9H300mP19_01030 [Dehalococcoidia bacterium]